MEEHQDRVLILCGDDDHESVRALASDARLKILDALGTEPMNVNAIAENLKLPQSTVATNILILEEAGLVLTENTKARKGSQKLCRRRFDEVLVRFGTSARETGDGVLEVAMPVGLYTNFEVNPPCGLCSSESVIGYLDIPETYLNPERMRAGLLWFSSGWVEYKFPNNSRLRSSPVKKLELIAELSSETPGTNRNWLSDITLWINGIEVGTWTSPGDFGDRRGKYTPAWWKLEGSQYGLLKHWSVTSDGAFVDGVRVSSVSLEDFELPFHHSVKVRLGVKDEAEHRGGMNLFGRGFGNYGQDLRLRLTF